MPRDAWRVRLQPPCFLSLVCVNLRLVLLSAIEPSFTGLDEISFPLPFRTRGSGSGLRHLETRILSDSFHPTLGLAVRDPDVAALSRPFDVVDRETGLSLVIIVEGYVGSHHNLDVDSESVFTTARSVRADCIRTQISNGLGRSR